MQVWIPIIAAVLALLTGCSALSLQHQVIGKRPDGTLIEILTGFSKPDAPPPASPLTAPELQTSLRRITVRYHGLISFSLADPQPLLTEAQAADFAGVLQRRLPQLAPDQRVRFSFKDAKLHNLNELDVYRDGSYIVYSFNIFVGNPAMELNAGDPPFSEADIDSLPGQLIRAAYPQVVVKDPVAGTKEAIAANTAAANAIIDQNHAGGLITDAEAAHLRAVAAQHDAIPLVAWSQYFDKRATLKKAREQGLMDDATYQTQVAKVEAELTAKEPKQ